MDLRLNRSKVRWVQGSIDPRFDWSKGSIDPLTLTKSNPYPNPSTFGTIDSWIHRPLILSELSFVSSFTGMTVQNHQVFRLTAAYLVFRKKKKKKRMKNHWRIFQPWLKELDGVCVGSGVQLLSIHSRAQTEWSWWWWLAKICGECSTIHSPNASFFWFYFVFGFLFVLFLKWNLARTH